MGSYFWIVFVLAILVFSPVLLRDLWVGFVEGNIFVKAFMVAMLLLFLKVFVI